MKESCRIIQKQVFDINTAYNFIDKKAIKFRSFLKTFFQENKNSVNLVVIKLPLERFSNESKEILWFWFTTPCDWFKKLVPPSQPIRCNWSKPMATWSHAFSRAAIFPRFEFSLVHCIVYVCCDWSVVVALVLVLRHSIENRYNVGNLVFFN